MNRSALCLALLALSASTFAGTFHVDPVAGDGVGAVWSHLSDPAMSSHKVEMHAQLDRMPAGSTEPSLIHPPGPAVSNTAQISPNPGSP